LFKNLLRVAGGGRAPFTAAAIEGSYGALLFVAAIVGVGIVMRWSLRMDPARKKSTSMTPPPATGDSRME